MKTKRHKVKKGNKTIGYIDIETRECLNDLTPKEVKELLRVLRYLLSRL